MILSDAGLSLLKRLEGTRDVPYQDSAGLLTTGVGHLLTRSELSSGKILIAGVLVRYAARLTPAQIDALLRQDLLRTEGALHACEPWPRPLTQGQYDALVSWVFNVGITAFQQSTLLKRLRSGGYDDIPQQLRRWVYAGGRVIPGLKKRREREIVQWNSIAPATQDV